MKVKLLLLNDPFIKLSRLALIAIFFIVYKSNAQFGRTRGDLQYGFYDYQLIQENKVRTHHWKPTFTNRASNLECLIQNNNNGKIDFMIIDSTIYGANGNKLLIDSRLQSSTYSSPHRSQLLLPFPKNQYVIITSREINNPKLSTQLNFIPFEFMPEKSQIVKQNVKSLAFTNQSISDMSYCRINENLYALATLNCKYIKDTWIFYINIYHITYNSSKLIKTIVVDKSITLLNKQYIGDKYEHLFVVRSIEFSNNGHYLVAQIGESIKETYKLENSTKYSWRYIDKIDEIFCYNLNNMSQITDSFHIFKSRKKDPLNTVDLVSLQFSFSPDDSKLYYYLIKKDTVNSGMINGYRSIIAQYDFKLHKNTIYHEPQNAEHVIYFQPAYWGDLLILTIDGISFKRKLLNAIYNDSMKGYEFPFKHFLKDSNEYINMGFGIDPHSYVLNYLQPKLILTNPCKLRYRMENTKRLPNRFDKFTLYTKPVGTLDYTDSQEVTSQPYFFPSPGKYAYYIRGSNSSTGYSEVYEDTLYVPDPRDPDFRNQIQPEILVVSTKDNFTNEVLWNPIPMAHHYQVFRDDAFLGNSSLNAFSDKFNRPINQAHTYYIIAEDSCEYLTKKSQTVKTIFLSNADDDKQININTPSSVSLTWNSYEGWSDPNPKYLLFSGNTNQIWEYVGVSGQNSYFQNNINQETWDHSHKEYFIQARNEKDIISRSNMLKVPLKPILYIPNVFTPNEDGKNDAFQLYSQGWKSLNYQVYNRWGEKVFETTDNNKNWVPGSQLSTGIFILKVQGEDLYQHKHYFKQVVYLLR